MRNSFAALLTLATLSACALPGSPGGPLGPSSTQWGSCPKVSAGGVVLVTVQDAAGDPVRDQEVVLSPASEAPDGDTAASGLRRLSCVRGPAAYGSGRTDEAGQYYFSRIEPGDYVVKLEDASPAVEVEVSVKLSRIAKATLTIPAEAQASAALAP